MAFCRSVIAVFMFLIAASQAHAACDPFPKSEYLGNFTHAQVQNYVNKAHGGDWTPYLVTLNNNLDQLQNLQRAGKGAVLKVSGKSKIASPTDIAKYVYVSRQWLAVAECLAEEQTMAALSNFATAAGSNDPQASVAGQPQANSAMTKRSVAVTETAEFQGDTLGKNTSIVTLENEVASLNIKPIAVKITSLCQDGVSVFLVTNTGSDWPSTGVFSMFRMDGPNRQLISARRLQLNAGEAKTFRVSKKQNLTGEVGLAIEPSWYKRNFQIDADAKCR